MGLTAGPNRVVGIDDETMLVLDGGVPVGMAMRFGPLPTFVLMVMMLAVNMQMPVFHCIVAMFDFDRIVPRPKYESGAGAGQGDQGQNRKGRGKPE